MKQNLIPPYKSSAYKQLNLLFDAYRNFDAEKLPALLREMRDNRISQLFLNDFSDKLEGNQEILEELKKDKNQLLFDNLYYMNHLKLVLRKFEEKHLQVVVLKGISFINHLYQDISLRTFVDFDFLIDKKDIEAVCDCLKEMGYDPDFGSKDIQTTSKFTAYSLKSKINIDLLTELDANPYTKRYFKLDMEKMWSRKEKITYDNINAYKLSQEDELLYMIYHMAFHIKFEIEIKWLFDLYYFLEKYEEELDRKYMRESFRKIGLQNVLRCISDLLQWVYGKSYPLIEENAAPQPTFIKQYWLQYYNYPPRLLGRISYRENLVHRMSTSLLKLALLDSGKKKRRFIFDRLLPGKERIKYAFKIKVLGNYKIFYWFIQLLFYLLFPAFLFTGFVYYMIMTIYVGASLMKWRYAG